MLLCSISAAPAANFKITDEQEGQTLDGDNDAGEVTAAGKITAAPDDIGIDHTSGKGVVITVKGEVLGTEDFQDCGWWSCDPWVGKGFASIPIKSAGDGVTINIIGNEAFIDSRDITSLAHAIVLSGNAAILNQSGGSITTRGPGARGISSEGNNAQITQSGGSIVTEGESAHGIVLEAAGNVVVDGSGDPLKTLSTILRPKPVVRLSPAGTKHTVS